MLVDAIMTELNAISTLAGRVEGGLEYDALVNDGKLPQQPVAGFVFSIGLDPDKPLRATSTHVQRVREMIAIVLVVQKADDPSGKKARNVVETLVEHVIDVITGFNPGEGFDVMSFARGRLLGLGKGAAFYQLDFSTHRYLRKQS